MTKFYTLSEQFIFLEKNRLINYSAAAGVDNHDPVIIVNGVCQPTDLDGHLPDGIWCSDGDVVIQGLLDGFIRTEYHDEVGEDADGNPVTVSVGLNYGTLTDQAEYYLGADGKITTTPSKYRIGRAISDRSMLINIFEKVA